MSRVLLCIRLVEWAEVLHCADGGTVCTCFALRSCCVVHWASSDQRDLTIGLDWKPNVQLWSYPNPWALHYSWCNLAEQQYELNAIAIWLCDGGWIVIKHSTWSSSSFDYISFVWLLYNVRLNSAVSHAFWVFVVAFFMLGLIWSNKLFSIGMVAFSLSLFLHTPRLLDCNGLWLKTIKHICIINNIHSLVINLFLFNSKFIVDDSGG